MLVNNQRVYIVSFNASSIEVFAVSEDCGDYVKGFNMRSRHTRFKEATVLRRSIHTTREGAIKAAYDALDTHTFNAESIQKDIERYEST